MGYAHDLKCPTDIDAPQAVGIDDRTGFKRYLADLAWQYDVRGNSVQNLRLRVGPEAYDDPAWILKPVIITGPEGVVKDPRPYNYAADSLGGEELMPFAPEWPANLPIDETIDGVALTDQSGTVLTAQDGETVLTADSPGEIAAPAQVGSKQTTVPQNYQKGQIGI